MGMDKKIEKKKGLKKKHIIWILAGLVFAGLLYQIITGSGSSVYRAEKDKLTISAVEDGVFNDYITVIGRVEPIYTVFLDVEEGGKVEEIYIEEGEMVRKGDVILRLKNDNLATDIMNSESSMAYQSNELRNTQINIEQQQINNRRSKMQVDLQVTQTERKYEQYKALYNEGLVAKEEYLIAKEDYELALKQKELTYEQFVQDSIFRSNQKKIMNESLTNINQNLVMARRRLENLNVRAPVDGQLGLLNATIGESISRGQRIGMVNILTDFKVNALIDEHYIDRVRFGLNSSFERAGEHYELKVKKVYPEVRDGQFEIDMVFEGTKPENIRTGQTYHTKLQLGQAEKALLLPRGSFFQSTGGQWVFVLSKDSKEAVKRSVRIGKQNPQHYEVLEGLEVGEKVITSSYDLFGDNDKIVFK